MKLFFHVYMLLNKNCPYCRTLLSKKELENYAKKVIV